MQLAKKFFVVAAAVAAVSSLVLFDFFAVVG